MKNMKPNYALLTCTLLFAFAAVSCVDSIDTDPKNLIGRWQMVKVIHQGNTILKPDPSHWLYEVEVEFLKDGKIEGTLFYDTFVGDYVTADTDSIKFDYWPYSKRGDSDWGYYFDDNIRSVNTFSLRKKGLNFKYKELYLNYGEGELIFDRVK
ncbi:hypothetical protein SAMN04487996_13354 [Dyadobacter soli]|uniref:Lipocalin-like domain-containing protein n=1 Tax=Dyadobacter soli TaxID=659014 RepID=A0A1G8BKD5_9BACT|nr:hypothetical protein [Dyadobacter soli]SDH33494.1 hypothetical protein SAMN04487996_13354 [Dyadobacter soli]